MMGKGKIKGFENENLYRNKVEGKDRDSLNDILNTKWQHYIVMVASICVPSQLSLCQSVGKPHIGKVMI